ncbi:hypothetical protein ACWGJ6_07135 [Streptomyces canus]
MEKQQDLTGGVVAVDFDGVLHSYTSGWTGYQPIDPPEPGAREFVEWLMDQGAEVVIVSSRANRRRGVRAIRQWLQVHGFPEVEITHRKVRAVAYVDDRAVPYGQGNWGACRSRIAGLSAHLP